MNDVIARIPTAQTAGPKETGPRGLRRRDSAVWAVGVRLITSNIGGKRLLNTQLGFSLSEVLVSLFLSSLILLSLVQFYASSKKQYLKVQKELTEQFDLQWVSDLLGDSIRRAGFTPCLGIDQLKVLDSRNTGRLISAMTLETGVNQAIHINRMSEYFTQVIKIRNPYEIIVPQVFFKEQRPIIIADCEHAEIHHISTLDKLSSMYRINLSRPLKYPFASTTYVGEWLEEKWFIHVSEGHKSLYYKQSHAEELSPLIHSLKVRSRRVHQKQWLEISLGFEQDREQQLMIAVRGS